MTAFPCDIGPFSTQEADVEFGFLIETDDGTPYEYEGGMLEMKVGIRRTSGEVEPLFTLTSADEEMEFRTDDDGNVYIAGVLPAADISDLEGMSYAFDVFETYGTRVIRRVCGFISFDNGVSGT